MDELERQIDRGLKQLPVPRAPEMFLPRVLLAVARVESAPWYSRAWVTWPRGLQVASAALLVLAITGLWWISPSGSSLLPDTASSGVDRAFARFAPAAHWMGQAATLGRVLFEVVLQPLAVYFFALIVALSFVCAVFWSTVNRVALGGASPQ